MKTTLKRELGLTAATAIVMGNMIGSGIFMAPQSLAAVSNPTAAIIGWIITAIGSMAIALSFARMGTAFPEAGGPMVYTQRAFGDTPAFLVGWSYWIGGWIGNAAIITAGVSYLSYFFPIVGENKILAFTICSLILWSLTVLNIRGVKGAGIFGIITTGMKLLPLLLFIVLGLMNFNMSFVHTVSKPEVGGMNTISAAIAIALWAFVGLESATVPAGEIKNPETTIRWSTIYGTLATAAVYILVSVIAMGGMPQAELATSKAPLSDLLSRFTGGTWAGAFIALGAVISTVGAASGWTLTTARMAYAAGDVGIFPRVFAKIHPRFATPHSALLIGAISANILFIMNYVDTLTNAFNFMILLSTISFLPAYAFTALAEIRLLLAKDARASTGRLVRYSFMALLAFTYSLYAMYGAGAEPVMYGFLLMLAGLPFFVFLKTRE